MAGIMLSAANCLCSTQRDTDDLLFAGDYRNFTLNFKEKLARIIASSEREGRS